MAEQTGLIGQDPHVTDGRGPIGQGHGQIDEHFTSVMTAPTGLRRGHGQRQVFGQAQLVGQIHKEPGTGM